MTFEPPPSSAGTAQIPVHHHTEGQPPPADGPTPESAAVTEVLSAERALFTPPVDIYESDEGLVLIADLPGVSVTSLELQVQNNKLTLLGRVTTQIPEQAKVLHKEYEEGDFLRSFILSEDVDHDRVTARLNNGVLEVVLPRSAKTAPRRIHVKGD
ncbi:MAG: Hsp20/alpha crystallin family protein [Planctomycetes bacterium]|nr:Hsp20/alpha crystallin family protein [Planctomycetota bacterium]